MKQICCFILLIMPFGAVYSVVVDDLYVAEVLVLDESPSQLKNGAKASLLQVLTRISGRQNVQQSIIIRDSLRNPAAYYSEYSYESSDQSLLSDGSEVNAKTLRVRFEPNAIARLLREADLPVWGSNRPSLLLWVAIKENEYRKILAEADSDQILEIMVDQAQQRGIPLTFPILDIEDSAQVNAAEVWGGFLERVDAASRRYNSDSVLTARIELDPGGRWSGRWSYRILDKWYSFENKDNSVDELARRMIDQIADKLAERFALGSSRSRIFLKVEDVNSVSVYAAVSRYLETLTPIVSSSIIALDGDVAEFEIEIEGQYRQLLEVIELDERLLLLSEDQLDEQLRYRWKE